MDKEELSELSDLCKKCNADVALNYCPNCGHPKAIARIDGSYLLDEIRRVLSFEKGFLFTIRELTMKPGKSIQAFIEEDRNRLVKPIVFLIVTSLIYSAVNGIFHFEDNYVNYSDVKESTTLSMFKWIQGNYGYANIIMAIFIALWIKLFFRKEKFNIFEIIILLCFIMGMGMLIYAIFGVAQSMTGVSLMQISAMLGFAYFTWAIGQFFGKRKAGSYIKAFFAYILGMISFFLVVMLIGSTIDALA